jgi:hypothetical protein
MPRVARTEQQVSWLAGLQDNTGPHKTRLPMAQIEARKKLIDILAEVSMETGVEVSDLIGPKRRALYVKARSLFARRARAADYKFVDIGEALGRSHSTILEYFEDEPQDEGGPQDMNKAEAKERVKKLNKADRKILVEAIAEEGTKEERDELAGFFSGIEEVAEPAPVETGAARREAPEPLQPDPVKKKSFWDEI